MRQAEQSSSGKLFWPVVWAVALHALLFALLFVSFASTPELPPSRPVIKATLYQLESQSQATAQTNQKIAGEAEKTSAPNYEVERLEQRKAEQERIAAAAAKAAQAKAEADRRAAEAQKQAQQRAAQAQQQAQAQKEQQAKQAAEKLKQEQAAKLKAAEQAKQKAELAAKQAEAAKQKAAQEAKQKAAAEAAKKKAAEAAAAKQKAEAEKKQRVAEEAARQRKAQEAARKALEEQRAGALAELLSSETQYQQTKAATQGSQVAGDIDDLIVRLVSEQWVRPPSARNGMAVTVLIEMLPDGTITNASVSRSSGDPAFDASAVAAVRNVGRVREVQQLPAETFNRLYRSRSAVFKPEDLSL
ncbi:MAG TPA: cell envelope integrity protein TolA [Thiopseudomonas sp.]|nr:cell envelope integrity protein TolA [Thiopseudomonas sp.]